MGNVAKFKEIRPNWPTAAGVSPEFQIPAYKYFDCGTSNMAVGTPPAVQSDELRLVTGVCAPGQGAPLHLHTGEEMMFAASGSWVIYFDEAGDNAVFLDPWDAIVIPGGIPRGWRNVGTEVGCLLNISCNTDEMTFVKTK
ncbi:MULTISPECIES: cupin domain-containing protein [unclassified Phenylobacterium]|uniref:cupin domain-containing protein n=1 Tax=unclassified Phenylobacterium TaxID=2640670 RepID=UPI00138F5741|nr:MULTISPECIES: cupin domain-containing protein [unclassified Phenylobacterium]